ncbi:hypothetical protein SAMN05216556_11135 [Aequorivita viscosa]|uniref:Uncharacterized protein n=1 Tax=Aequorivita viscosa TaxID=797419 RepID=A0A1M6GGV1_9FLAO|nr:hypothetical protein [Aequorivita viscosa]SDW84607.1 hypothetical protein SAMN05216556_11135 [Aequorivita viscosa]SHJ09194.1 hypothetical protein SAMN04487908_10980 [Aequorivita viscosa]
MINDFDCRLLEVAGWRLQVGGCRLGIEIENEIEIQIPSFIINIR